MRQSLSSALSRFLRSRLSFRAGDTLKSSAKRLTCEPLEDRRLLSVGPSITAASMVEGQTIASGDVVFQARFDKAIDETYLDAADVFLRGETSGAVAADSIAFDAETNTLSVGFLGLGEDAWRLTLYSGDGQIEDLDGNDMAGGNWTVGFKTDSGPIVLGGNFERVDPLGSVALERTTSDTIDYGADRDTFVLADSAVYGPALPDAQEDAPLDMYMLPETARVLVTPAAGLQPTVAVYDATGQLIESVAADAPGQTIALDTPVEIGTGQDYSIVVGSAFATTGEYDIRLLRNEGLEAEWVGGPANNARERAQYIDVHFMPLGETGADRAVILGQTGEENADWYRFTLDDLDSVSLALESDSSDLTLGLCDAEGTLLATGTSGEDVVSQIANYIDATENWTVENYFIRVAGPQAEYRLVVGRGATFDAAGSTLEAPLPLGSYGAAFGYLDTDVYSFTAEENDALEISASRPYLGPLAPSNSGSYVLKLLDADGTVLTESQGEAISLTAPAAGEYRVAIERPEGDDAGEYVLQVTMPDAPNRPIVVSTADDIDDGDHSWGKLSLREAVALAAENEGPDTIRFAETLLDETITIAQGQYAIEGNLQIIGPGADRLTITGHDGTRIFIVSPESDVTIAGMTLSHGRAKTGAAIDADHATLTVYDCTFEGNHAVNSSALGGAIRIVSTALTVSESLFVGNDSDGRGGAISVESQSTVEFAGVTFRENHCDDDGGALFMKESSLDVVNSVLDSNGSGDNGGGMYINQSEVSIARSTFVENRSDDDGGAVHLYNDNVVHIDNTTFSQNYAYNYCGALRVHTIDSNNTVTVVNSTFYGNSGSPNGAIGSANPQTLLVNCVFAENVSRDYPEQGDLGGTYNPDSTGNVIKSTVSVEGLDPAKNLFGVDPLLGPLDDNGGPTQTHALLPGSPAIDAGVTALAVDSEGNPLEVDQRGAGYPRVLGMGVDAGAFEFLSGDADQNGAIGALDLDIVRGNWGKTFEPWDMANGEYNGDGVVDAHDLDIVRSNWGIALPSAAAASKEGDQTGPSVVATSVKESESIAAGETTISVRFDEPIATQYLTTSAVSLFSPATGHVPAESIAFDAESLTLTAEFTTAPEAWWTFTLVSGDGFIEDLDGNDLEGGNYVLHFATEAGPAVLNESFERVEPLGTMALEATTAAALEHPHDRDTFLLGAPVTVMPAAAGLDDFMLPETARILVVPSSGLEATATLYDSTGAAIETVFSDSPGEPFAFSTPVEVTLGQAYSVVVGGRFGTSGEYAIRLLRNEAVEMELAGGPGNNARETAEYIDGHFVPLAETGSDRAVLVGHTDGGTADWFRFSLADLQSTTLTLSTEARESVLRLYDAEGTLLATGAPGESVTAFADYVDTTEDWAEDAYFVRVAGTPAEYRLVIARGAAFNAATADSAAVIPIGSDGTAFGYLDAPFGATEQLLFKTEEAGQAYIHSDMAIDGGRAIVGLTFEDRENYVAVLEYDGTQWNETARLAAPEEEMGDAFGASVAIQGDYAVVGAPRSDNDALGENCGAVYVFRLTEGEWTLIQKLQADDLKADESFGFAVDLDGETIAVGTPWHDTDARDTGSVYVYTKRENEWTLQQKIIPEKFDYRPSCYWDLFGYSLSLSGNTLAVGSPFADAPDDVYDAGLVTMYTRTEGVWSEQQKILGPNGVGADVFGESVVLEGDLLVAGGMGKGEEQNSTGEAYVFEYDGTSWALMQLLGTIDSQGSGFNGDANWLDINGDTIVMGDWYSDPLGTDSGSVRRFVRTESGYQEVQQLAALAVEAPEGIRLGYGCVADGDHVLTMVQGWPGFYAFELTSHTDLFSFTADEGEPFEISATRPYLGAGAPSNAGSYVIQVLGSEGAVLAESEGEPLSFTAPAEGEYVVSVHAKSEVDRGEYVLQVESLTALPRPIVVSTVEDVFDGDYSPGNLSLREAVALAAENEGPDTIRFAETLPDDMIALTQGELSIGGELEITGPASDKLTISGGYSTRLLNIAPEANVTLTGLTFFEGTADYGGVLIADSCELTIHGCTFQSNQAEGSEGADGGVMWLTGADVDVTDSRFVDNVARDDGGAVYLSNGSTMTVAGSVFYDHYASDKGGVFFVIDSTLSIVESTGRWNGAGDDGGVIYGQNGTMNISRSMFSENHAGDHAGVIWLNRDNRVTIDNSTFSNNNADQWCGVLRVAGTDVDNTVTVVNSTFYGNSAKTRGTIGAGNPNTLLINCIFAGNTATDPPEESDIGGEYSPDCAGNIFQTAAVPDGIDPAKNLVGVNPLLGPLADNGGPTLTHALLPGSPAIDAGVTALAANSDGTPLVYDQRGLFYPRVVGGAVDIGAVEYLVGDANGDNIVGSADLDAVRANWGEAVELFDLAHGDLSGDGVVNSKDLDLVRSTWGVGTLTKCPARAALFAALADADADSDGKDVDGEKAAPPMWWKYR